MDGAAGFADIRIHRGRCEEALKQSVGGRDLKKMRFARRADG